MQNGIHIPERIERGLQAYGEQPNEYDISLAKARVLAGVEQRKNKRLSFTTRGAWVGLAVGAVVLALAVTGNQAGIFKSHKQNPITTLGDAENVLAQKINFYHEKGQTYVTSDQKGGWDLTYDKSSVYLYENGHSKTLVTIPGGIRDVSAGQFGFGDPLVSFTVLRTQQLPSQYLFDRQEKKLIDLQNAECIGLVQDGRKTVLLRDIDEAAKKQIYYLYDLNTQKKQEILEKASPYFLDNIHINGDTITASSQFEIIAYRNGSWSTIATSPTGDLVFLKADHGEVLYLTNGSVVSIYHGNQTLHRYDRATGKNTNLLPNLPGDQELLLANHDLLPGYLITKWVANADATHTTDPLKQMGTLTLWHVSQSGEAKKITEMTTTYEDHKAQVVQDNSGPIVKNDEIHLYLGHDGTDYYYSLKTDVLRPSKGIFPNS